MNVLGIIAEFNPFHNGHLHLLQEAKKSVPDAACICVMSGNFLQRGDAALCNKWSRAEMAINAGADLVLELPFCFAVRSAYYFARGAIQLLERTGVVTHLPFGSESGNLEELQRIATIISNEGQDYQTHLKKHLAQGTGFARARSLTLQSIIKNPDLHNIWLQPNNILALEYLHVLTETGSRITALTIPRRGPGYHSDELSAFASASAIRMALINGQNLTQIAPGVPPGTLHLLANEIAAGRAPIKIESLGQSILLQLRLAFAPQLAQIYEVSEGLENRILKAAEHSVSLEELRQSIKSKRYTLSRINRILLYSMLNLSKDQVVRFDDSGPLYLHVLGFSPSGQKILQEIKFKSLLPIFSRGSAVKKAHQDDSNPLLQAMLDLDRRATDIYTLLYPNPETRQGGLDFSTSPVRVESH